MLPSGLLTNKETYIHTSKHDTANRDSGAFPTNCIEPRPLTWMQKAVLGVFELITLYNDK